MSLINRMLRDLQTDGHDSSLPGRRFSAVAKHKVAIIRQLVAVSLGLVFLGIIWLACDFVAGTGAANQHPAATDRDARQGQPAPAGLPAKQRVVNRDSGPRGQNPVAAAPLFPPAARGVSSPGNDAAEAFADPALATGARLTSDAGIGAEASPQGRVTVPPSSPPNAVNLWQHSPDALTEEEATVIPYASAEQAYQAGKRALLGGSNNDLAVRYLRQALTLNPGHLLARDLLAEVYHKVNRNDAAAMDLLREGIDLAPGYTVFTKKYSRMLADRGDNAAAVKVLLHGGLPAIKGDAEALEFLAVLYLRLEEPYLASQTYRNLVTTWPRNGNYWFGLGAVLDSQGQAVDAVNCYRKALETNNLRRESKDQATRRMALLAQIPPG